MASRDDEAYLEAKHRVERADRYGVDPTRGVSGLKRARIRVRPPVTGTAHLPTRGYLRYNTQHYEKYDSHNSQLPAAVNSPFTKFGQFDGFKLFSEQTIASIDDIPKHGVRLDDYAVAYVLGSNFTNKELHEYWPAEFDREGMVRATRVPPENAATMYVKAGDRDIHGDVVMPGEEGYYYKWWAGMQCLCGEEGLKADKFLQRPSHEQPRCDGFGFEKGCKP